jgi:mycothiol system anti-sigma-R factor
LLNCQDVLQELANYLDDDCAQTVRRELEAHLAKCSACQVLVDSTRKTIRLVTSCSTFELPPSLSEKVMAQIALHRSAKDPT